MGKRVKLPGRVESAEMGGIVTGAGEILDDLKGKTQEVINTETSAELLRLDQTKQVNLTFDQTPTENSTNPVTSGGVYAADQLLSQAIESILLLIPSAASALNKLVDLATMNSSISTATASFKGTYNLVSDLHLGEDATHAQIEAALDAMSLNADNNDYAFVQVPNTDQAPTEIKKTERYKFNGTNWAYEYDLNNSGFTAAQWAAINSNITAVLVTKLSALPTNEALTALLAGKQDNLTFDDSPMSGSNNPVKSGGIYTRNNEIIAMITALDAAKQDVLTFDTTPTENSTNPVTSNGVYQAINLVQAALAALDGRMLTAEHSIEILTEDVGVLRTLYQALSQSDIIVGTLPATGVANTVYRVPGTSTYADWMYYDGAWVKMAEYTTLDGYLYKGIATPSSSPAASADKMLYFALTAGTYTNFGNLIVTEGISILKYDGANWSQDKISYMDGGVFDVTAYSGSSFASLDALLSDANLNNLIPSAVRKGGMSIKFVHTNDNKYVQFRLMSDTFNTTPANWQGVDDEPTSKSKNLIESGGVAKYINQLIDDVSLTIQDNYFYDDNLVKTSTTYQTHIAEIVANKGELYIINSTQHGSLRSGVKDANGNVLKLISTTDTIFSVPVFIPSDNCKVCVSFSSGYGLDKPHIYKIKNIEELSYYFIENYDALNKELGLALEKVNLSFQSKHFYNPNLVYSFYDNNDYSCAEVTANKGETYILDVKQHISIRSGLKDSDGNVKKVINDVDTEIVDSIFVCEDNCTLCISKYVPYNIGSIYKVNIDELGLYVVNQISSLKTSINAMSVEIGDIKVAQSELIEKISLDYQLNKYYDSNLELQSYGTEGYLKAAEITANAGEVYVYNGFTHGSLKCGMKDANGEILSISNVNDTNFKMYFIAPSDGCKICISKYSTNQSELCKIKINSVLENTAQEPQLEFGSMSQLGLVDYNTPDDFDFSNLFIYGQSLAVGGKAEGAVSLSALDDNYKLSTGINTTYVDDYTNASFVPLKQDSTSEDENPIIGAINAFSTLWRRNRKKDSKFVGIVGGGGGLSIERISKGTDFYTRFINAVLKSKQLSDAQNKTSGCIGIVFMQGESNYETHSSSPITADESKTGYKDKVVKLKKDLQEDIQTIFGQSCKPIFFIYQTGYKWIRNNHFDCSISQAQLELSQEMKDVVLLNPTYQLTFNTSNHPNYNGYRWYGEYIAKGVWNALYHNNRYETVKPVSIRIKGHKIVVNCYAPVYPLHVNTNIQPNISNYGFDLKVDGVVKTIKSVTLEKNSIVLDIVDFIDPAYHLVEITYAGLNRNGSGNICDSDTWNPLSDYEDDSATSIYNSPDLTSPVNKRPVDINGVVLFGKKYPMQNWLTSFYFNLSFYFIEHLVKYKTGDTIKNKLINLPNRSVSYTSSDTTIATVDSSGSVSCLAAGSCVIEATTTINDVQCSDSYLLIVE